MPFEQYGRPAILLIDQGQQQGPAQDRRGDIFVRWGTYSRERLPG
jgi:hypothetical protein